MFKVVADALVGLVALEHVWFLVLEMFLWQTPFAMKTLGMSAEEAALTAVLAKNQGLYNGFLAAGLAWALFAPGALSHPLKLFFLGCVIVAGVYGGFSARMTIIVLQALPAAVALGAVLLAER